MKSVLFKEGESGEEIGRKLYILLNKKQKEELIYFFLEQTNQSKESENNLRDFSFPYDSCLQTEEKLPLTEKHMGELYFCWEYRTVYVKKKEINLTVKEFDILALLIMHPKRVFTYEMIMDLVWHEDYTFYSRKAVNNHVSNLRKKLKIAPDIPDYIKSVYGVGYKFEEVDDKTSIGSPSWRETRVDGKKVGSSAPETPGIFL